jgi:hypothetical protein
MALRKKYRNGQPLQEVGLVTTHKLGDLEFSAAEWAEIEAQKAAARERLVLEHGEEWVAEHKRMLDSQWEYAIGLGLVGLVRRTSTARLGRVTRGRCARTVSGGVGRPCAPRHGGVP